MALEHVWNPLRSWYDASEDPAPNPSIGLLSPGQTVVAFGGMGADSNSPCNLMPATPESLAIIDKALAEKDWKQPCDGQAGVK